MFTQNGNRNNRTQRPYMAFATIAGAVAFAGINFALCESNESKCVEIPFANELSDGNMKALLVGDKPDQKVLISRY
jgi:hypothetical protein